MNNNLTRYLQMPEKDYRWRLVNKSTTAQGTDVVNLELHSLRWSPGVYEPSHAVWKHRVALYIPSINVPSLDSPPIDSTPLNSPPQKSPKASGNKLVVMHVNGGTRYSDQGKAGADYSDSFDFAAVVEATGTIVVDVKDIPNQYLALTKTSQPLKEDDLIASTWADYLENPKACVNCPLQFPMTKAVIKAMDAVQDYLKQSDLNSEVPSGFLLTGSSKRGWVSWLVAATDPRVVAVMPMVIDTLNVQDSMTHLHKSFGGWIPPLQPYARRGIMAKMHSPEMDQLLLQIDPWRYRHQLTLPKYVVSASGDDFFPPDAARFSLPYLKGATWTRSIPNARHYIHRRNAETVTTAVTAFTGALVSGRELPKIDSSALGLSGGVLRMSARPRQARIWQVTNPESRDFRMTTLEPKGLAYQSSVLEWTCQKSMAENDTASVWPCVAEVNVPLPDKGWKAWFVELHFANEPYPDFIITTPVKVSPDRYP